MAEDGISPESKLKDILTSVIDEFNKDKTQINPTLPQMNWYISSLEMLKPTEQKMDNVTIVQLFNAMTNEAKLRFLQTKPETELRYLMMKTISIKTSVKLHDALNDEFYFADLILHLNSLNDNCMKMFLPIIKDPFIKGLIVNRNVYGEKKDVAIQSLKRYQKIREEFDKLETEEEKVEFIKNLPYESNEDQEYATINDLKISLLSTIKNPENRKVCIDSMKSNTEEFFVPYADAAKKMILEYFESNGGISDEQRESVDIVFKTISIHAKDLSELVTKRGEYAGQKGHTIGITDYINGQINIDLAKHKDPDILLTLIHEALHFISNLNSKRENIYNKYRKKSVGKDFEEGTVEAMTQMVKDHWFTKHDDIEVGNKSFSKKECIADSYALFISVIKSLLSGVAHDGKDNEYMLEYFFGEKMKAYDLIHAMDILIEHGDNKQIGLAFGPDLFRMLDKVIGGDIPEDKYRSNNRLISSIVFFETCPPKYVERSYKILCDAEVPMKNLNEEKIQAHCTKLLQVVALQLAYSGDRLINSLFKFLPKIIQAEKKHAMTSVEDVQNEVDLYEILSKTVEQIKEKHAIPAADEFDGLKRFAFKKITKSLDNPEFVQGLSGKYKEKDFESCPELLILLKNKGVELIPEPDVSLVCDAVKSKGLDVDDAEKAARISEQDIQSEVHHATNMERKEKGDAESDR